MEELLERIEKLQEETTKLMQIAHHLIAGGESFSRSLFHAEEWLSALDRRLARIERRLGMEE